MSKVNDRIRKRGFLSYLIKYMSDGSYDSAQEKIVESPPKKYEIYCVVMESESRADKESKLFSTVTELLTQSVTPAPEVGDGLLWGTSTYNIINVKPIYDKDVPLSYIIKVQLQ